jgi:hypothetical protein
MTDDESFDKTVDRMMDDQMKRKGMFWQMALRVADKLLALSPEQRTPQMGHALLMEEMSRTFPEKAADIASNYDALYDTLVLGKPWKKLDS